MLIDKVLVTCAVIAVVNTSAHVEWPISETAAAARRQVVARDYGPPKRIVYVAPDYDEEARRSNAHGRVCARLSIRPDGSVAEAEIVESRAPLDEAVLKAARQWRFERWPPGHKPQSVVLTVCETFPPSQRSAESVAAASAGQVLTDPDTYAVYAAALSVGSEQYSKGLLVLRRDTAPRVDWDCISGPRFGLPSGWQEVVDDYARQNRTSWQLLESITFPERHVVVSPAELPGVRGGAVGDDVDAWQSFREKHSGARGYFALSAVGFDATKTRAMLFIVYADGPQSGTGYYTVFERGELGWQRLNVGLGCGFIS